MTARSPSFRLFSVLMGSAAVLAAPLGRTEAPDGRFVAGSGSEAGTVLDSVTGLRWQQAHSPGNRTFSSAATYCADATTGGFGDWRLPSMKELQTIVDETESNPAIDSSAFPSTAADFFWTSSERYNDDADAWRVDFADGSVSNGDKGVQHRVRCVH